MGPTSTLTLLFWEAQPISKLATKIANTKIVFFLIVFTFVSPFLIII
jgi:hypothetical protein